MPIDELDPLEEEELPVADDSAALGVPPSALDSARGDRDQDIAIANIMQGIAQAGSSLGSQGRVKPESAVFDAIRANANTKGKEALSDATLRQKKVSDFMKQQLAAKRQGIMDERDERNFKQRERGIEATKANQDAARDERKQHQTEEGVRHFSKSLSDSGLDELGVISDRLGHSLKLGDEKADIPGYGQTYAVPDLLVGDAAKQARQDVQALKNVILKARSGGSVTPQEAERMLNELGDGPLKSDAQLRRGVGNVLSQLKQKAETIKAGASPEVVSAFTKQGGRVPFAGAPPTPGPGGGLDPAAAAAELAKRRGKK